jgi:NAD(P)-dependent dehydrogenase (short-subunit alcohol dehydrogenase family)
MANYLIVGGTHGIGKSLVELLLIQGHQVWFTGRNDVDTHLPGSQGIQWQHNTPFPTEELPEILDGIAYLPGTIELKPFHRLTFEQFQEEMNVNTWGAVQILQTCLGHLKKSNHPAVVLFSTIAVQTGMPFHSSIAAAKGALEGLTRSLAAEWAPLIRVNAIAPSLTITPLSEKLTGTPEKIEAGAHRHPMKKIGTADDIAQMAQFLLTSPSNWMTGQILHLDGGMSSVRV